LFVAINRRKAMMTATRTQQEFYLEFLMGRGTFEPSEFGIDLSREEFTDQMVEDLQVHARGQLTIDEMLLRPRQAMYFCDWVRAKRHYYDVPDDIILRVILTRRKSPK
jgi:hypothetical protein